MNAKTIRIATSGANTTNMIALNNFILDFVKSAIN